MLKISDTEVTTATIKMRLENRGCSIPPEINSYVPLPHVFLLVFIPHSYFFPLLLIQQTTLKFLFQAKDNCAWKEQLTPGVLHVSFSNHWHRKLFLRTFVHNYRQQSLFFLAALFLITSEGKRENETVVVERHLDFMCFSMQSLIMS